MKAFVTVAALVVAAFLPARALAQQTGTLAGTVRDAQGAVLPGVAITISGPALAASRTATTGEGGAFSFAALPPGVYEVTYELTGFSGLKREGVRVQVAVVTRARRRARARRASRKRSP